MTCKSRATTACRQLPGPRGGFGQYHRNRTDIAAALDPWPRRGKGEGRCLADDDEEDEEDDDDDNDEEYDDDDEAREG